jgi:hypothetical protein
MFLSRSHHFFLQHNLLFARVIPRRVVMGFFQVMNAEGCGWNNFVTSPVISVEVVTKLTEILSHKSGSNEGLREYESGATTTTYRHSVPWSNRRCLLFCVCHLSSLFSNVFIYTLLL